MSDFPHLRAALMKDPWAIDQMSLTAICEVVERRAQGVYLSPAEIAAIKGEREPNGVAVFYGLDISSGLMAAMPRENGAAPQSSVVAVISVFGIIAQHASQVDDISGPGGTSTERVKESLKKAIADPSVKAIVMRYNSPGGNVYGVQALADEIMRNRGRKPIVAQVDSIAASAAYWLASASTEVVVTPGGEVGSIGVYCLHCDMSEAAKRSGLKFTFVSAGKYKVEGNGYEPLSDPAFQSLKKTTDSYYADFTSSVAKGRNVPITKVRNGFGEGRMLKDHEAVREGMADRVGTLDQTLQRLIGQPSSSPAPRQASAHNAGLASTANDADAMRRRRHALRNRI